MVYDVYTAQQYILLYRDRITRCSCTRRVENIIVRLVIDPVTGTYLLNGSCLFIFRTKIHRKHKQHDDVLIYYDIV